MKGTLACLVGHLSYRLVLPVEPRGASAECLPACLAAPAYIGVNSTTTPNYFNKEGTPKVLRREYHFEILHQNAVHFCIKVKLKGVSFIKNRSKRN